MYFAEALNLVKDAIAKVDFSISYPNFISKGLEELEENYERMLFLLPLELSKEEQEEFVSLVGDGTDKHLLLMKVLQSFASLLEIRRFDQSYDFNKLSSDEIEKILEEEWIMFNFNKKHSMPKNY